MSYPEKKKHQFFVFYFYFYFYFYYFYYPFCPVDDLRLCGSDRERERRERKSHKKKNTQNPVYDTTTIPNPRSIVAARRSSSPVDLYIACGQDRAMYAERSGARVMLCDCTHYGVMLCDCTP